MQLSRHAPILRFLTATAVLLLAAGPGPARADTETGLAQFRRGQFAEALRSWRDAANKGDARAALYVGVSYDTGAGLPADPRTAALWYQRAADGGNPAGMFNLAVLYGLGLGVPRDPAAAIEWYGKAAARSHPRAAFNLGLIYEDGIGTPPDKARAAAAFQEAARLGVTAARSHLAGLGQPYAGAVSQARPPAGSAGKDDGSGDGMREFREAQQILLGRRRGASGSAMALLRTAAEAGNAMAAYDLGYFYENGIGTRRDPGAALQWYARAAKGADSDPDLRTVATAGVASAQAKLQYGANTGPAIGTTPR